MIDVPVRVRDALKSGAYLNNYRVVVLDDNGDEDFTIDNDNLVTESVKIDERMCSTDTLKFGLCEGTNVEFQFFGYPNITNRKIKLYIDVNYRDADKVMQTYSIPLGWYQVKECSRQAETGIIKASGYNKLLSDYLDQDVTEQVKSIVATGESGVTGSASVHKVLETLLDDYSIEQEEYSTGSISISTTTAAEGIGLQSIYQPSTGTYAGKYVLYANCYYALAPAGMTNNDYYQVVIDGKRLREMIISYMGPFIDTPSEWGGYTWRQLLDNASWAYTNTSANKFYNLCCISHFGAINLAKEYKTQFITNGKSKVTLISLPCFWGVRSGSDAYLSGAEWQTYVNARFVAMLNECVEFRKLSLSPMETFKITTSSVSNLMNGVTLRGLQSATFELSARYGKLDRVSDLFSGVTLNGGRLLPSDTLYPANDLYPMSVSERADKAMYSKLWADEGNIHKFRNLIVTYKNSSTNQDATITKVVNADGTDDYVMSDNWLLKNLPWTQAQVNTYANAMVTAMQNVTWFPFQMWCAGLPYIEAGDEIEISYGGTTYTTYVLTRNLSGIQDLQDVYVNGTLNIF